MSRYGGRLRDSLVAALVFLLRPAHGDLPSRFMTHPESSRAGQGDEAYESLAVQLARSSGEIVMDSRSESGRSRPLNVRYKQHDGGRPRGPVTEFDLRIERSVRDAIARRFPDHGILGEELPPVLPDESGLVWAIDPIDGTTNFVHGMPLVTVSVACLEHGVPVAGAVWCSSTHGFRPGVYHARRGEVLRLDGEVVDVHRPEMRVGLVAAADGVPSPDTRYDLRTTGSAALDCAFTAAGILRASRLARVHAWDVAAGILLVKSAGRRVLVEGDGRWASFERFDPPLGDWHRALLMGDPEVVDLSVQAAGSGP